MVKWNILSKNPKYGKIGTAKLYSRIKILLAGALMGLSVIFLPSSKELGIVLALSSAIVFVLDIHSQTKSAIDVEKRIGDLEKTVKSLEDELKKKS